jgi:hypothetical protein
MESTKKTAVSLLRTLADRTERAARRRGIPRSRLYVLALEAFLVDEQSDEELTEQSMPCSPTRRCGQLTM